MSFQLDTSGAVSMGSEHGPQFAGVNMVWSDLSPFTQGYVEALFLSGGSGIWRAYGFSILAPEALARIIADETTYLDLPGLHMEGCKLGGQKAWIQRQAGWPVAPFGMVDEYRSALPPLTVQLGDDGKVRFA